MCLSVDAPVGGALDVLSRFRVEFYECLYARADALFELTDAVLCADGPVNTLVELSLAVEHRRAHGALYAAWTAAGWNPRAFAARWPTCRCRRRPTAGSCRPWT
ncbi:hypothetical protein GCM10010521_61200 [Streptomyces rameus]|uniref:Transposase IS701-like DDE domain-containing protein n=1 Tax=Streptomyces rameus TaxID=68261 RepID=A0ABP6HI60_9ACTN